MQLAAAQQLDAGARQDDSSEWQLVAGGGEALSTEYPHHAGVYRAGERTWAVNRSAGEDKPAVLGDEQLQGLFGNLEFDRIDDRAGSLASLTHEIWRVFLVGMLVALVAEAALSLPRKRVAPSAEERFA